MQWIRLYISILDSKKIAKISSFSYRIFTYLLLFCREKDFDGEINVDFSEISWRVRLPEKRIIKACEELLSVGILSSIYPIIIKNWSKRQYQSDNVSARVSRHRAKSATLHETLHETLHATPQNRADTDTEQIQNRTEQKKSSKLDDVHKKIPYSEIIEMLNHATGKAFRSESKKTQSLIKSLWQQGFVLADFERVIANKASKWMGDPKFGDYLRPETLFGTKFESYLNESKKTPQVVSPCTKNNINTAETWLKNEK